MLGTDQVSGLVDGIVQRDGLDLHPERLADGLLPPTNKWFSGLVFGDVAQPVFPLPLSFGVDDDGFALGLPTVTTNEKTIMGGYAPIIDVTTGSGTTWKVTAYDELSVTMEGTVRGDVVGTVTIAEGSPFVSFTASSDVDLTTNLPFASDGDAWSVQGGASKYGLVTSGKVSGTTVELDAGQAATWFAVPSDGTLSELAKLAADPVVSTSVSYEVADRVSTTVDYHTRDGGQTAVAAMPHQNDGLLTDAAPIGSYPSIFGTLTLYPGTELNWYEPRSRPRGQPRSLGAEQQRTR